MVVKNNKMHMPLMVENLILFINNIIEKTKAIVNLVASLYNLRVLIIYNIYIY